MAGCDQWAILKVFEVVSDLKHTFSFSILKVGPGSFN